MFDYCPRCRRPSPDFIAGKKTSCPDCGFTLYQNVASAVAVLIRLDKCCVVLRRGREPGLGQLDLPGGFVDPDESAEDACRREVREELGVELKTLEYLVSRPNTYPYKGITYKTCDLFFMAECSERDFVLQEDEISEVLMLKPDELILEDFAFGSVRWFLERTFSTGKDSEGNVLISQ